MGVIMMITEDCLFLIKPEHTRCSLLESILKVKTAMWFSYQEVAQVYANQPMYAGMRYSNERCQKNGLGGGALKEEHRRIIYKWQRGKMS